MSEDDDDMVSIPRMDMARPVRPDADLERLREAYKRVANFPEFNPDERALWLEFRKAAEKYLERR